MDSDIVKTAIGDSAEKWLKDNPIFDPADYVRLDNFNPDDYDFDNTVLSSDLSEEIREQFDPADHGLVSEQDLAEEVSNQMDGMFSRQGVLTTSDFDPDDFVRMDYFDPDEYIKQEDFDSDDFIRQDEFDPDDFVKHNEYDENVSEQIDEAIKGFVASEAFRKEVIFLMAKAFPQMIGLFVTDLIKGLANGDMEGFVVDTGENNTETTAPDPEATDVPTPDEIYDAMGIISDLS